MYFLRETNDLFEQAKTSGSRLNQYNVYIKKKKENLMQANAVKMLLKCIYGYESVYIIKIKHIVNMSKYVSIDGTCNHVLQ